ncbi:MAG: Stk1 family PASTA domain-containing Ser/Thr kinase [Desulfitobacteriaceae bacterium]|nr:Stk1 family PASTA domain-containing Ser/Thr kinase [Desulfitobacteriaceae bacterium]
MIGKKFGNRYEIIEKLGSGGMSIVYKGLDTLLNRLVTIKVLREQYASDEDFVRRFQREAQSVASLSHINIVSIFDVGFEENLHYLVMEFVEGQNLKEYIREKGKVSPKEAVPITMQILDALQHAHEHGVVHRDIKPHNILLTKDNRVKVTDFGIARAASETTVTYTGTIVGSVHYISPEQAKGSVIGARADIYAAGVVLYEMLTGQLPFTGESPIAVALQHIQSEPEMPHEVVEGVSFELSQVVRRAMQKNPDYRYESAREMRADLEKVHSGRFHEINFPQLPDEDARDEDTARIPLLRDKEQQKKRKRLKPHSKWIIGGSALLAFLLVVLAVFLLTRSLFDVAEAMVPPVEGESLEDAQAQLKAAGLEFTIDRTFHDTVKKDYIISQSIPAGQVVKKNRVIDLEVSDGPKLTTVPNVKGKSRREAELELENHKLKAEFSEEFSNDVPQGTVISQQPSAGDEVPEKSTVNVVLSAGVEPKYITVPDLYKMLLEKAEELLKEKGLELGNVKQKDSTEYFTWQVMSQKPEKGTLVLEGDTVDLEVSQGPGPMADIVRVTYQITDDGKEHRLQVVVEDSQGEHEEYDRIHQPGELIVQDIPFYGSGKVSVYLDGEYVLGQDVP